MRTFLQFLSLSLLIFSLGACNDQAERPPAISNTQKEDTPPEMPTDQNEQVLADTFFFGCAYLDANGNGEVDADDPKIADMNFTISLAGGGGFGGRTSPDNCAMVIIPGGLDKSHWPVTARMQPPPEAGYELIGPEDLLLEYPDTHADFLFRGK